ncbi:MAG: class I SAM-dependent methyltransferase [Rhodocyclaceae bacterium]
MKESAAEKSAGDAEEMRFGFGANWADYIDKNFSDERVEISRKHLLGFLKLDDLTGKTFLDIGCGSGLHSLAAWRSGAARVVSFDYDSNSVATTKKLRELSGSPENWTVMQGSVLDEKFVDMLPKADIVYSWGVLHHTGSMWKAIENAARCMGPSSVFYIALYSSDVYVDPSPEYWLKVKREYNVAGPLRKAWMEWCYAWKDSIRGCLIRGKSPFAHMRRYKQSRGMSYWHDVRDWLGGYPMEFAGNKETEAFAKSRLNMELIHIKAGEGNTEFLFRPAGSANYWEDISSRSRVTEIPGPFQHLRGKAWQVSLPVSEERAGSSARFMLYEDGSPVGWPNAPVSSIECYGGGRYRVENGVLIFSTTDHSDPNLTSKSYVFRSEFA